MPKTPPLELTDTTIWKHHIKGGMSPSSELKILRMHLQFCEPVTVMQSSASKETEKGSNQNKQ